VAETAEPKSLRTSSPRRSPWPWVLLALWVAWVLVLAWLGRGQWGVPRDGSAETQQHE
jgi:hypothetical protein